MAAQGLLPLGPVDLLELLHQLLADPEESVRQTAAATMGAVPKDEILPIAKDRSVPAPVLAWILSGRQERDVLEVVLQNVSLPDEAIEAQAPHLPMELAELVVINQVRLLRRTSLLVAIESNPSLNNDQKRRLRELRETFKIGEEHAEKPAPPPAAAAQPAPPPAPPPEPEPEPEPAALSPEQVVETTLEPEERLEPEKVSMAQAMAKMTTKDKLIKALKGDRQWRALLIRDPNRLVSRAVLGSPNVTDAEIESFAGMKNVSDQILRTIGSHRDWTKKYTVVSSLVKNPRTPLAISLGMVARLNPRDLKSIAVDKNVPEAVRKQAQKFVKGPQQQGGGARH